VINAVQNGAADIGIISAGLHTSALEELPYFGDPAVIITSLNHQLAARKRVAFEECLDYDFVAIPGARWIDAFLGGTKAGSDKPMRIRAQGGSYESVCCLVEADIGIAVMQESAAKRSASHMALKIVQLSDDWADTSMSICARSFEQLPRLGRTRVEMMTEDFRLSTSQRK
jgi:DNA-binding transcriptional LysR family regulator